MAVQADGHFLLVWHQEQVDGAVAAHIRRETGALVLAVRLTDGTFESIPGPEVVLAAGTTLIALGTGAQLKALEGLLQV